MQLNRVCIGGFLGRAPEPFTLRSGLRTVKLSVAVNERHRDQATGERKEYVQFVPVWIINEGLAKIAIERLRRGSAVYVEGKFDTPGPDDQNRDLPGAQVLVGSTGKLFIGADAPRGADEFVD